MATLNHSLLSLVRLDIQRSIYLQYLLLSYSTMKSRQLMKMEAPRQLKLRSTCLATRKQNGNCEKSGCLFGFHPYQTEKNISDLFCFMDKTTTMLREINFLGLSQLLGSVTSGMLETVFVFMPEKFREITELSLFKHCQKESCGYSLE